MHLRVFFSLCGFLFQETVTSASVKEKRLIEGDLQLKAQTAIVESLIENASQVYIYVILYCCFAKKSPKRFLFIIPDFTKIVIRCSLEGYATGCLFIKYCVFSLKFDDFFWTLPVLLQRWCSTCLMCVHTLTQRENRERPESGIFQYFKKKKTVFNEHILYLWYICIWNYHVFNLYWRAGNDLEIENYIFTSLNTQNWFKRHRRPWHFNSCKEICH